MFTIRREPRNPILAPEREHPWEAFATFNPSVIREENGWRMYYRALSNPAALVAPYAGQSTIGEAFSEDGLHFHSQRQVLVPEHPWEAYGCEDPRATVFEGVRYLSYTALGGYPFSKDNIKVGIAVAKDGRNFTERHCATPFNAKAFAIFPNASAEKSRRFCPFTPMSRRRKCALCVPTLSRIFGRRTSGRPGTLRGDRTGSL